MNVRALMVDVDGVIVRRPDGRRWDHRLETDLGIAPEALQRLFFEPHFDDIVCGRADLFERLEEVRAPALGTVTPQELATYWFEQDATLDERLLTELAQARQRGLELHLATVQEHYRAQYLWESLGLRQHFDAMHYAADLGWRKCDREFYRAVEDRTGFQPHELCLIDDTLANVELARTCGWRAYHWKPESQLRDVLAGLP